MKIPFKAARGFSLLEVTVATVLLAMIITVSFILCMDASRNCSDKLQMNYLEIQGERVLKDILMNLSESSCQQNYSINPATGKPYYTDVQFSTPMDNDGNGWVLPTANLNGNLSNPNVPSPTALIAPAQMERGAVVRTINSSLTSVQVPNGCVRYSFQPSGKVLDEAQLGVDLNGDGDMNDTFDLGSIICTAYDSQAAVHIIDQWVVGGADMIVQRSGAYGASIIDDTNPPGDNSGRIFYMPQQTPASQGGPKAGERVLTINLCLMSYTQANGEVPHFYRCRGQLYLRNQ